MRILDARIHFILDVAFALAFAIGPLVYGLGGSPAVFSFLIALVFVVLAATLWRGRTDAAVVNVVHGLVELAVALLAAVLPRIDGYSPGSPARHFFWTMAIIVGVVWLLTAWGKTRVPLERAPGPAVPRA